MGKCVALYLSTEPAHIAKNDIERTVYWFLVQFARQIKIQLPHLEEIYTFVQDLLKQSPVPQDAFSQFLQFWSEHSLKPLAIFFDEIDGLVENSLIFFLKQLRTGYINRPQHFPQAVCLIGVRNLQDYKLQTVEESERGILISPFNIVADSLLLRNFSQGELNNLYNQHTREIGQKFTDEALDYAYCVTQGQPWLVNALAYQACFREVTDRTKSITQEILETAKEQLILRRDTHISALVDRLNEPRVRDIIDAIISGSDPISFNPDDIQYVRDLGLVRESSWEIANPIYQQVIPRALTYVLQELIPHQTSWYVESSGKLNVNKLLSAFTQFFRENAQAYSNKLEYRESFPHLLLMAFLQRIINGGGKLHREYVVGSKRRDLLIVWQEKYRYVIELKIKRGEDTLHKGLEQTADYVDLCNGHEAHLLIFDRDPIKTWDEKISNEIISFNSKKIHVWTL